MSYRQTSSITPYQSFPIDPYANLLTKEGNICTCTFRCILDESAPISDGVIGTIPAGFRPCQDIFVNVRNFDSNTALFLVKLGADSYIQILGIGSTPITPDRLDFYVSTTWILN
jgi:hypothetical protein